MPTQEIQPAALSVPQAAAYLGVSRATVYRISAERGEGASGLEPLLIRGRRVLLREDLDAYLQSCRARQGRRAALP